MSDSIFDELLIKIRRFAKESPSLQSLQEYIVDIISKQLPYYNWAGFYMLDPNAPDTLVLGPFRGVPTTHVRIHVTEGICGAAVAQDAIVIVDDVNADPRYLACSLETKSEIVVPIRVNGNAIGEIDIDSHNLSAFGEGDRIFLEQSAKVVGLFIETSQEKTFP